MKHLYFVNHHEAYTKPFIIDTPVTSAVLVLRFRQLAVLTILSSTECAVVVIIGLFNPVLLFWKGLQPSPYASV